MKTQTLVKLYSDNHDGTIMTIDQYKEEKISMSTGEFHTHKAEMIHKPTRRQLKKAEEYSEEYKHQEWLNETFCHACGQELRKGK